MDNPLQDKDSQIRLTIRQYILPLIHAIYEDDPADVVLYCFGYFEGLLREREFKEFDDSAAGRLKASSYQHEQEKNSKERISEPMDFSCSNLQGSASEPLLTKDKHGEGLSLRETSSWDIASSHPYSAVPRDVLKSNIADAMSKIGDQLCSKVKQEESPERDIEAGDTSINKEKETRDNNSIDNRMSTNVMCESTIGNKENTYALPSAPPFSIVQEEEMPRSHQTNEATTCQQNNCNTNAQEAADKVYEVIESDICDSSNVHHPPCTREKIKQLSPNSSFGFIPHLNRYESEEEPRVTEPHSSNDFTRVKKSEEQMKYLCKKMSEAFNPLAQEFNSAINNFNEKFQNSREISDVIPNRIQNYDSKESDFKDENNNYLGMDMNGQGFEPKDRKCSHKALSEDKAAFDQSNYSRNTNFVEQEIASDSSKFRSPVNENLNLYKDLGKEGPDSTQPFQYDTKKNDARPDSFEARQTIDETWRRRWYEAHSSLDSTNEDLRLRALLRGNRELLTLGNYSNDSILNIGEAGDIPSDRARIVQGPPYERLNSFQETSQNNSNPSFVKKETSSSSFSSDESSHNVTTDRSNRNYTNVSSQSIPYSWRQICRKQVSSTESEAKAFKQSQKPKENGASFNQNILASQKSESLSEVITDKEKTEVGNSSNGRWSESVGKGNEQYGMLEKPEKDDSRKNKPGNEENCKSEEIQKDLNQSRANFYRQNIPHFRDRERIEGDNSSSNLRRSEENIKNLETKERVVSSEAREDGRESRVYGPEKVEPGLNAACGDFVPARDDQIREQEVNNNLPTDRNAEENPARNVEESFESISSDDYLQEIMERNAGEQEEDSSEAINFMSYSESDKSSDFSEAEEALVGE